MKNNIFLLLIITFTTTQFAFSQTKFSYGAEIGINSSVMPHKNHYTIPESYANAKETNMPVISPVLGLWAKFKIGKHFFTNLGVQYLWVGNKYHYHYDGNDLVNNEPYTYDNWEKQTFQKISIPLTIGYDFRIKNLKAIIFLGFKENYFTKGSYYSKRVFVEENITGTMYLVQKKKPFDKTQFSQTAKRWNPGLLIGFGIDISKKMQLNLSYSINQSFIYGETNELGAFTNLAVYDNSDIALSIKYTIK